MQFTFIKPNKLLHSGRLRMKKILSVAFASMLLHFFCITTTYAQNTVQVSGTILNETGKPVPGASIVVKGSNTGVSADSSGTFKFQAPSNGTLIISSVGFALTEEPVNSRTSISVTLNLLKNTANEVIVVGYGTQRKKDVTGAIVSLTGTTLREVPSANVLNQLKGRAAGVSVVSNGSTPGTQGQIRIRGSRSLTSSSSSADALDGPLVVVDGIPFGGLNDINPDDIATMEILKDASSTAIFGSRGAGGVILITTKRGRVSKPVFSYDGYFGTTKIMGQYNVMNGTEYAQFKSDAAKYNRNAPGTSGYLLTPKEQAALDAGVSTDWQDQIYQTGFLTNHQLGLQGGTESTQYSLGIGYLNETGIIPDQNYQRSNIRASIDQKIGKRVKIGLNTINTLSYQSNPGGGGVPGGLVRLTPLASVYNEDGTLNLFPADGSIDAAQVNPLTIETKSGSILSRTRLLRTFNSLYGEVTILPSLKYRLNVGLNYSQSNFNGYFGPLTYYNTATVQSSSSAEIVNTEYWDYDIQNLLYYDKTFAEKHRVSATGLFEVTQNHSQGSRFTIRGVPADYIGTSNFSLASGQPVANNDFGNFFTETGLLSYMARVNYSYDNRYLFTATIRRDGSSTLSPGNQYFNYPSIGVGWNAVEESFLKESSFVSALKLRASWGIAGNRNVDPYGTLGALSSGYYNFGTSTAGQQLGYTVTTLPAPNLGWQSTEQVDIGVDFGFWNNRLTGTIDVYHQNTSDILLNVLLPQSNGAGQTLKNLGATQGKGLEVAVSYDIIRKTDFNWGIDLVYFFNREEITQLSTPEEKANIANGWFVGQPITVIYDYKKLGIWQTGDADKLTAQTSPKQFPGQIRVEDVDGNGIINPNDRQVLGNYQPKWEGSLTSRFTYKNFDANFIIYGRMGQQALVPYLTGNSTGSGGFAFFNQSRVNQVKTDYWTEENPTNAFPAPDAGSAVAFFGSTLGYYDGSFIKCRSINIGYTFSSALMKKIGATSARVYLNATNPFIIYSPLVRDNLAIDPEGNGYALNSTLAPQGASEQGTPGRQIVVNLNNPPVRQFIFGLNFKF